ncbi:MAG TPA: radical SAM protein [bacterium]|nr:radical SAM protein [bacterium]
MYVFGPVPSRRLGVSLGLDVTPRKTCSLNCVYCQLGPTDRPTVERRSFFEPEAFFAELEERAPTLPHIDYATFSGSGEPTLNADLGYLIEGAGTILKAPVAVITNGTLCSDPAVRADLARADLLLPSLDAASQAVFERVNRPAPGLDVEEIIAGLAALREEYGGGIHLEILLVAGLNDTEEELGRLRAAVSRIGPDVVHLNTVVRPPAVKSARAVPADRLLEIAAGFDPPAGVIADYAGPVTRARALDLEAEISTYLLRRPARAADLAAVFGCDERAVKGALKELASRSLVRLQRRGGETYYTHAEGES